MRRRRRPLLLLGLTGLACFGLSGLTGGWREAAGAYLAAWLALLALPAGALPVTIVAERFGQRVRERGGGEMLAALRRLMGLMPAAGLLGIPLLAALPALYPWAGTPPGAPAAAVWFTVPFFAARAAAYLAAWTFLARRFARPFDAPGEARTVPAVALHAVIGTLFAVDVVGSLDPRPGSALLGVLLMTAWSGLAFAAAILLAWEEPEPVGRGRVAPGRGRLVPLVVLLGLWAYLHGVQFLVASSVDRAADMAWYMARGGGLGRALAAAGGALVMLAGLQTLRPGRVTTRLLAGAALAVHGLEMFWLVIPALRDRFTLRWSDGLAALALVCLAGALRGILAAPRGRGARAASAPRGRTA